MPRDNERSFSGSGFCLYMGASVALITSLESIDRAKEEPFKEGTPCMYEHPTLTRKCLDRFGFKAVNPQTCQSDNPT